MPSARRAAYWGSTALASFVFAATGTADLLRVPVIMDGLAHLGYPAYFATLLGTWELLGAAALVAPGIPRLKEWAYAGMFFTLTGAAVSHALSGDSAVKILVPLIVLGALAASWALRPMARTLSTPAFVLRRGDASSFFPTSRRAA